MSTISVSNINDGDAVTAASVNNQVNTIVNDYNGGISNANIASGAAIGPEKIAGGNASMLSAWTSYTPTWTNDGTPAIVNGTLSGRYVQIGKTIYYKIQWTAGSSTTFGTTGGWKFSLPTTSAETKITGLLSPMGTWTAYDSSTTDTYMGMAGMVNTTTIDMIYSSVATAGKVASELTSSAPVTWAVGDSIYIKGFYESA